MPKPNTFMDTPNHCEECQEVESKAQAATPETLTLEQAGRGWADLHNFLNDYGFLYYLPAFIRLCIDTDMKDGFLDDFLFAVTYQEEDNRRLKACNSTQKKFIGDFLMWYKNTHPEIVRHWAMEDEIETAINLWHE